MSSLKDDVERLLTRAEVAEIFRVAPSTITRWAEAGKLPAVKTLGGHRRYEARAVKALVQRFIPTLSDGMEANYEEESSMENVLIHVPAMYGDHHVLEVRRLLLEIAGVADVHASSCFQTIEVTYDPLVASPAELNDQLDKAGYLDPLAVPVETGAIAIEETQAGRETFFRHTAAFEQAKQVISFAQDIHSPGRALWPCPGLGPLRGTAVEPNVPHQEASHG